MDKFAKIVVSNTYFSSFEKVIFDAKNLAEKDKFANIIFVVPDKFSLNAEQFLFSNTQRQSWFNIWTTTLSRLVSKVLQNEDKNHTVLTKNTGIMLVSKILQENLDKISTYKKVLNNYALAEKMFNVINLLKSSGVKPNELLQNFDNSNFGLKIKDIFVVYSEYEKQMASLPDKITRLEIFNQKIKHDEYIKKSHIFFANFESFTNAQLDTLTQLAKSANSFEIGLCANSHQKNANVYDNVVFARIISKFKEKFVPYQIENITANFGKEQNQIAKNMFSFDKIEPIDTNKISLFECANIEEEVQNVASEIKYLVLEKKHSFEDINVAVCGLGDYQSVIEKVFADFDFPFYVDKQRDMLSHYFSKTLCKIFDFSCGQNSMSDCISIVKSPLFDFDEESKDIFEDFCQKHNIFGKKLCKVFKIENSQQELVANSVRTVFDTINDFCEQMDNCESVADYVFALSQFLQKIDAKERMVQYAEMEPNVVLKNIDLQVFEKFEDILQSVINLFGSSKMPKEMFFEMIKSNLSATNLKTVPLVCDAIFVGDASESTYLPKKVLFVLGASSQRMPVYQSDYGTITDSEIAKIKANQLVNPTIKELNKREKFKLFNLILSWQQRLVLSYSTVTSAGVESKSEFVTALQKLFLFDNKPLPVQKMANNYWLAESDEKFAPYIVGSFLNAIKISKNNQFEKMRNAVLVNLNNMIEKEKTQFVQNNKFEIANAKQAIFPKNVTSTSQIEQYFCCPFKQFVSYAIKPQQKQKYDIKPYEIGSILHKIAEIFVKQYKNDNQIDISKTVKQIAVHVLDMPDFCKVKKNGIAVHNIFDEAERLCLAIRHQFVCGNYLPYATEWRFDDYILPNGLKLKGFVDRVDVCKNDNSVRIVDYKTGSQTFDFASAYYGTKLQLVCYLKIVAEHLKKRPTGAFYMPVKNSFLSGKKTNLSSYMLDGFLLDNDVVRQNFDKELLKNSQSDVIKVKYTKSGELDSRSLSTSLDGKQFLDLQNYCFEAINNATNEMIDGFIMPKPIKNKDGKIACELCEFKAICQYNAEENGYRKMTKKDKQSFSKNYGDGENE